MPAVEMGSQLGFQSAPPGPADPESKWDGHERSKDTGSTGLSAATHENLESSEPTPTSSDAAEATAPVKVTPERVLDGRIAPEAPESGTSTSSSPEIRSSQNCDTSVSTPTSSTHSEDRAATGNKTVSTLDALTPTKLQPSTPVRLRKRLNTGISREKSAALETGASSKIPTRTEKHSLSRGTPISSLETSPTKSIEDRGKDNSRKYPKTPKEKRRGSESDESGSKKSGLEEIESVRELGPGPGYDSDEEDLKNLGLGSKGTGSPLSDHRYDSDPGDSEAVLNRKRKYRRIYNKVEQSFDEQNNIEEVRARALKKERIRAVGRVKKARKAKLDAVDAEYWDAEVKKEKRQLEERRQMREREVQTQPGYIQWPPRNAGSGDVENYDDADIEKRIRLYLEDELPKRLMTYLIRCPPAGEEFRLSGGKLLQEKVESLYMEELDHLAHTVVRSGEALLKDPMANKVRDQYVYSRSTWHALLNRYWYATGIPKRNTKEIDLRRAQVHLLMQMPTNSRYTQTERMAMERIQTAGNNVNALRTIYEDIFLCATLRKTRGRGMTVRLPYTKKEQVPKLQNYKKRKADDEDAESIATPVPKKRKTTDSPKDVFKSRVPVMEPPGDWQGSLEAEDGYGNADIDREGPEEDRDATKDEESAKEDRDGTKDEESAKDEESETEDAELGFKDGEPKISMSEEDAEESEEESEESEEDSVQSSEGSSEDSEESSEGSDGDSEESSDGSEEDFEEFESSEGSDGSEESGFSGESEEELSD